MTEEEKRKKLLSIYNDDDLVDKDGISKRQYAEYVDTTGGMHYTPAPTPSATTHRDYAAYSQAKSYMDLSDTQKADKRLYNQWQAYQKAIDARKNAQLFSRDETKARNLAKSLKQELKKAYAERYGSDAGFGKWLASGTMTGLMGFANSAYQTAGMVEDTLTNAANNAYWTLNYGIGGPDRWMKSYFGDNPNEDDPMYKVYTAYKNAQAARKGAGAGSGVSGDTWMSAEEQLRDRLEQMYRERVNDDNLFDPEGGLLHQAAEYSNELYNWQQERNQTQTEFQKMRSNAPDKVWDVANQLVIGTAQAVPYAAFGMLGVGAAGGEIGAQLSPQTTGILNKVADTLQHFAKSPDYWLAFTQETGNTYREALDAGASQDTAAITATLVGLINGAIEIGMPGGNGGIQDLPERLMKVGKSSRRKAVQEWVESAVSEGKEEVLQGVISNLAEKLGYNKSKAWVGNEGVLDAGNLAKEGFMGMAVGGILGGGQSIGVNAYNRSMQNKLNEQYRQTGARFRGKADTIIENALNLPETTEANKLAQELKSRQNEDLTEEQKKSLYSDEEIGRLYAQTLRDTGVDYNARADALGAIEERLQKLGETSNTRETAQLVLEAAENGALSTTAKATALKNSKYGQRVLNEYRDALSGELVPQYDSEWADKLQLREMQKKVSPELTQEQREARTERIERVLNDNVNPAEESDINALAEKYGAQANIFKEAAKTAESTDLYYFDDAYHTVYQLAKNGLDESTIRKDIKASWLSPSAFKLAYNAGQDAQTFKAGSRYNPNATLQLMGIDYKGLNNKQRASVRALMNIAKVTGINIKLFDSTLADGTLGAKQGSYSNGTIWIDVNAGMLDKGDILNVAMLRTTSHELTHFIQQNNKDAYQELKDFVFDRLQVSMFSNGKYYDADTWIREKMSSLKMEDTEANYAKASDEVVADACEMMLKDSTAFETLAKENPNLAQRVLGWLKQIIDDIKKAFSGVNANSTEAKAMIGVLDELQQKWDAALVGAVQNTKLTAEETTQLNEAGVEVNEEYATVNSVRYLLDADKKAQLAKLLAKQYGVTEQEAKAWMNAETSLASMILNPKYSAYLDYEADPDEDAIKKNSDYPQGTVDFSNICAKRREFTMIMNRILRIFPYHVFTATDLARIRTIMEEEGMTVPCAICFVEDRRQHDTPVAQSFIDNLQRYRNGETTDINGKKFGKGQIKAFEMVKGDEYTPTIYELASLEGLNQLKAKDNTMKRAWETYNNARGMASIRLPLNDAEYKRQILGYSENTVKSKNDHGGLRIYSFSDLEMFHLIDILQVITDSSVVGLKIQGYTKVNEYAKAVRNTGEKLNRSLIPAGDLGYHIENGKVILDYDTKEGIDVNHPDFFDNTDNPDVGNIVIGINATQIRAAMVSKFIDQIIPFHTGQSSAVLQEKGLAAWQNYKDSQTEKDLDTGRTSDHQINIYTEVLQVLENEGAEINKRSFVEKFLEVCKENNLRPRFAEFLNVDENGDYVYTEGYHKFLVDFKTFAQTEVGEYLPQLAVKPDFDNEYISTMLEQYVKDQKVKDAEIAEKAPRVIERIRDEVVNADAQNSIRVTPEQDARYLELAKDPQKNEAELTKLVQDAARQAGYDTPMLFHGTRWFGWTVYEDTRHETPFIYTSTNRTVSAHYAGDQHYAFVRPIGKKYRTGNSISDIIQNADTVYGVKYHVMSSDERQRVYDEQVKAAREIGEKFDDIDATFNFDIEDDEQLKLANSLDYMQDPFWTAGGDWFTDDGGKWDYDLETKRSYLDSSIRRFEQASKLLREWRDENRNSLTKEQKNWLNYALSYEVGDAVIDLEYKLSKVLHDGDILVTETGGIAVPSELKEAMDSIHEIAAYQLYGNLGNNPFTVDANGAQFWAVKVPEMGDGYYGTDAICKWALEHGYTSVIMKNIYDYGDKADNYVFFGSSQIKSADPVTYDDSGNVIPLSERFNAEDEDIRYSTRITPERAKTLEDEINSAGLRLTSKDNNKNNLRINAWLKENRPELYGRVEFFNDKSIGKVSVRNILDEDYLERARQTQQDETDKRRAAEQDRNKYSIVYGDDDLTDRGLIRNSEHRDIVTDAIRERLNNNPIFENVSIHQSRGMGSYETFYVTASSGDESATIRFSNHNSRYGGADAYLWNNNYDAVTPLLDDIESKLEELLGIDAQYQLRETGLSAREILSSALTDVAETDAERSKLISYQRAVKSLDETQTQLDDIKSQIHDIMFTKGSDRSKLKTLNAQKAQLEKKLDWWDKRLMGLQNTAPLKAVLERERTRVRKKTKAETLAEVRYQRETRAVRKSIKSMMEKWNSKLQANDPNKNIPAPFARTITELSEALDLTSGRPLSEKAVDKLNKLKSVYDIIMNDEDYKTLQDPITKMYLDNAINAINNTPLREMGREQLEALYDAMKCINNVMFEANKLRDKAYRHDMAETGRAMISDTDEAIAPKWKFWRDYETWQLTPERFFAMLGGWKKGSVWEQVAASFKEGTRRSLRYERDFYNEFREFTESPQIDRLTNPNKLIDIGLVGRDGKPVKITRGMMLSIYMHLLAEDNRRAILYGGLNVPVLKEYYGQKIAESYTTGHENVVGILEDMTKLSEQIYKVNSDKSLSEEEKQKQIEGIGEQQDKLEAEGYDRLDALKNRIYNEMTDFEKKLTEKATYWNDVKSAGYINEVTMEQYQIKRARVKNYWAIHRDTSFVKTDFESIAKNMNLSNVGWLKDRVKSAAPVLLTDFVYELDNSCKRVATFYGYSIAQADFNKLYNYKLPGVNKSVKDAVKSKFGGSAKNFGVTADQYVENFIGDVVGSRVKPDTTIWAAIRRNLPRASLTLNPRVAVSQIASVPTAAAEVGWGAMTKGFFKGLPRVFNKEAKAWLDEHDEYFWQRHRGDGGMREFADMKSGNNIVDKLFTKADKLTKHVLFNWCQNFDIFATATMWSMAEEWVKANTNLTGEEFDAAVKEKYDAIITKTQPNYTTTERSDLLRDTRDGYKFLTMYKTQSNQNFNILKEANARLRKTASDFKNKKNGVTQQDLNEARKQFANAYSAVFLGGTLAFVLLRALANALLGHMNDYRDDDDEITLASMLNGITVACMQSLSGMFALGSEFEALVEKTVTGKKYYGLEDTALASVNNALTQFQAIAVAYAQGETDGIGKKWAKLMQNGAQIVGIPYSPGKTWYEAVRTWAKDIDNGSFGSFEGGVERTNTTNYNRLYKALENGDTAKADRIRDEIRRNSPDIEDKTIESGLRGVIKGMWADGLLTESEAVDKLVDYTGKDKDTAYWDVQKWSNKANAEDDEKYTNTDYYRLWQVIDSDGDAEAAMSELLEHGKDADQIAQDVRKHIKDAYTNGEITDAQARERILRYGQHKENKQLVKYTKAEADKLVNGWVTSNTLGWDYDDKETLYAKGEISKSELKTALVDIGGMTSQKADERIEIMDWNKEGYAVENDKYDSIIGTYNKELKSKGISKSIWYNYYVFESKTSGEVDANGKSIPYSKMRKLFEYIGKLNITNDQKMALARTYTDSESSIAKYKTW